MHLALLELVKWDTTSCSVDASTNTCQPQLWKPHQCLAAFPAPLGSRTVGCTHAWAEISGIRACEFASMVNTTPYYKGLRCMKVQVRLQASAYPGDSGPSASSCITETGAFARISLPRRLRAKCKLMHNRNDKAQAATESVFLQEACQTGIPD